MRSRQLEKRGKRRDHLAFQIGPMNISTLLLLQTYSMLSSQLSTWSLFRLYGCPPSDTASSRLSSSSVPSKSSQECWYIDLWLPLEYPTCVRNQLRRETIAIIIKLGWGLLNQFSRWYSPGSDNLLHGTLKVAQKMGSKTNSYEVFLKAEISLSWKPRGKNLETLYIYGFADYTL